MRAVLIASRRRGVGHRGFVDRRLRFDWREVAREIQATGQSRPDVTSVTLSVTNVETSPPAMRLVDTVTPALITIADAGAQMSLIESGHKADGRERAFAVVPMWSGGQDSL